MSLGERNLNLNFFLSKIEQRAWKESFGEGFRSTQSEVGSLRQAQGKLFDCVSASLRGALTSLRMTRLEAT
jgi:hypothetical protein